MRLHISHNHNEAGRLPKVIFDYMNKRFLLTHDYLTKLRCFEYEGTVGDKKVRRIRIFNPDDVTNNHLEIKTKNDLEAHPEIIIFEGYIDALGKPYAADRRKPKTGVKIKNK